MPNRILKETICSSETINKLTEAEENLFYRLIVQCDDYGRLDARPRIVISKCYPLKMYEISEEDIIQRLLKLAQVGLIKFYIASDNKPYLQITNWDEHQRVRNKKSKYPDPLRFVDNPYFNITATSTSSQQLQSQCSQTSAITQQLTAENEQMPTSCYQLTADCGQLTAIESNINQQETIAGNIKQLTSIDSLNPNPNPNPNINNKSVIANAITPRTGSDERTCVTEEHRTSTTTQEKKLEDEQGMAVTSEPEQVTDTEVQPETNNNALITSGEEELEQLLEEFFEDGNETAKKHETAKIEEPATATGECERKKPSVPVEVPEDQETAESRERLITTGVELEDSGECNILQQDQDTAITQDHLIADEEEEIEKLLEEFFAGMPDQAGAPTSIMPTEVHDSAGDVPSERVQTGYDNFSPPGSQQEINTDGTHTVSNSGVATAVASRDAPACAPVNTSKTEDYQEEPVEKAPEVTNQDLIGILTHKFHEITKPLKHRSDYSYIGGLYNKFNYFIVDSALDRLKRKVERDGPMDSMKSYRAYLTRVCMNINQECVNPAGAQKERKQYSKARTLKVSTEEIKKQIETQATLF
jgi:hypothetical protein